MDRRIILAFRAGQLNAQGMGIREAFNKAYVEERTMQDWMLGLLKLNRHLDVLISQLEKEAAKGSRDQTGQVRSGQ